MKNNRFRTKAVANEQVLGGKVVRILLDPDKGKLYKDQSMQKAYEKVD
jgi:hypothetical protein